MSPLGYLSHIFNFFFLQAFEILKLATKFEGFQTILAFAVMVATLDIR